MVDAVDSHGLRVLAIEDFVSRQFLNRSRRFLYGEVVIVGGTEPIVTQVKITLDKGLQSL